MVAAPPRPANTWAIPAPAYNTADDSDLPVYSAQLVSATLQEVPPCDQKACLNSRTGRRAMSSANGCDPGASTMIFVNRSASGGQSEYGPITSNKPGPAHGACSRVEVPGTESTCFAIETPTSFGSR
ncbi:unnamed protein product, partial [Mesorhabditis spiculigera]